MYRLMNGNKVIAKSENLLRLLKIKFMTERDRGLSVVLEIRNEHDFIYDIMDLAASDYFDFTHFCDRVYGGKYYGSYNYIGKCL